MRGDVLKDWLVCPAGGGDYWLTRIEVMPNGREKLLCGCCDGELENSVVALFESSKGTPGTVACSICSKCDLLLSGNEMPKGELDKKIELTLTEVAKQVSLS